MGNDGMSVTERWTGQELHSAWVDAPHSDKEREWRTMNIFDRARWEKFAIRLNDESQGAVAEAVALIEDLAGRQDWNLGVELSDRVDAFFAKWGG